jgi:hypothetical protein
MNNETTAVIEEDGFDWKRVEIFGHRTHYGRGREEDRYGSKVLRIDIPTVTWVNIEGEEQEPKLNITGWTTLFYGGGAIFSEALTDEETVLRANAPYRAPSRLTLPSPLYERQDDDVDEEVF